MAGGGKRLLIGCGVGCLGLVVLAVGSCVGFTLWLNQPGDLLEPQALLGPDTVGYVEWRLSEEDPGTRRFAEALLDAAQQRPEEFRGLPPVLAQVLAKQQNASNRKNLRQLLPLVAVWTLERGDGPDDLQLLSVSVEHLGNRMTILDWLLGLTLRSSSDVTVVRHGDERIYEIARGPGRGFTFFIHHQDLFFTTGLPAARQALDRLVGVATADVGPPTEVERDLAALPPTPLRGALDNRRGELRQLWQTLAGGEPSGEGEDPWSGIRALTLRGEFTGETSFEATLDFRCVDAAWAASRGAALAEALRTAGRRPLLPDDTTTAIEGDHVRLTLRYEDIPALLRHDQ